MNLKMLAAAAAFAMAATACQAIPEDMTVAQYCAQPDKANMDVCKINVEIDGERYAILNVTGVDLPGFEGRKPGLRPVAFGDCEGTVQPHHWRRPRQQQERVIEHHHGMPVGASGPTPGDMR